MEINRDILSNEQNPSPESQPTDTKSQLPVETPQRRYNELSLKQAEA